MLKNANETTDALERLDKDARFKAFLAILNRFNVFLEW